MGEMGVMEQLVAVLSRFADTMERFNQKYSEIADRLEVETTYSARLVKMEKLDSPDSSSTESSDDAVSKLTGKSESKSEEKPESEEKPKRRTRKKKEEVKEEPEKESVSEETDAEEESYPDIEKVRSVGISLLDVSRYKKDPERKKKTAASLNGFCDRNFNGNKTLEKMDGPQLKALLDYMYTLDKMLKKEGF